MQEQVFEKVTPEHFEVLSALVRSETGIEMRGNSGEAGHNGYEMKWNYVGDTLTLQCTKKPWLFPEQVVVRGIELLVTSSDPEKPKEVTQPEAETEAVVGSPLVPEDGGTKGVADKAKEDNRAESGQAPA